MNKTHAHTNIGEDWDILRRSERRWRGGLDSGSVRPSLGVEPPFLALLHALDRPVGSPDRDNRFGAAAADPTRSYPVTLTHPPPPPPPLPHLQPKTMRPRKYISDDDSPSSSSTELEIELSCEASGTRRHYLRKCHPEKYQNPKVKTEIPRVILAKVTMSVVELQRTKETCVFPFLIFSSLILGILENQNKQPMGLEERISGESLCWGTWRWGREGLSFEERGEIRSEKVLWKMAANPGDLIIHVSRRWGQHILWIRHVSKFAPSLLFLLGSMEHTNSTAEPPPFVLFIYLNIRLEIKLPIFF